MPLPTLVQNLPPLWDYVVTYPTIDGDETAPYALATNRGEYLQMGSIERVAGAVSISQELQAAAGGGTTRVVTQVGGANVGFAFIEKAGTGNWQRNDVAGMRCVTATDPAVTLPAGASLPSARRVWILQCLIRWLTVGGPPDNLSGIIIQPDLGTAIHGWPTEPVGINNRGGFGIVGDGAGQWVHNSYDRSGVALIRYTDVLPVHTLTDWNLVEFQIIGNRPGIPATLEVWWNGDLVTTRNWTGADLELCQAQEWRFTPWLGEGATGTSMFSLHMRRGRFTRTGIEI